MSGDGFRDGRPALGDVTNRPAKRGFSLVFDDHLPGAKSRDGRKCSTGREVDRVEKGAAIPLLVKDKEARGSSPAHDKFSGAGDNLFSAAVHNLPSRSQELLNASHSNPKVSGIEMNAQSVVEVGDASRDSCTSIVSTMSIQAGGQSSDGLKRGPQNGKLASNASGSIEWSRLPNSQGLKNFELIRCQTSEGNGRDNLCAEEDPLKSCCCSFCLKAAHMWSDLHYQDIKGRITAVSKSRKEASSLAQKIGTVKDVIHVPGNSDNSPNLEYALTNQWRSLFLHMEDILVHEGRELQSSYCELKDMREKCKMDLESTNRMPLNRH
ncbi:uncharacterized protein LOC104415807 [Eucalyptus grandis]|uniref:uncharacterized protein LOC104415807 n=1 Tax=Eucalyptus grandis TaxID=71139 RepID=UPI00192ECAF1|nr:uncharacterized protein LOC104415807 [Eucalyptus grandis]